MRVLFAVISVLVAVIAVPSVAQQTLSDREHVVVDRFLSPPLGAAFDICLSDDVSDAAGVEASWIEAGWPPFRSDGDVRVSDVPPGERQIVSFAVSVDQMVDAQPSDFVLTCTLLTPVAFEPILHSRLIERFGATEGVFFSRNGALRESPRESRPAQLRALHESAATGERAVILSTGREGPLSYSRIHVLLRVG